MNTNHAKKALALLLTLIMVIGFVPMTAFADETVTVTTYNDLWRAFYANDNYDITLGCDIAYTIPDSGNTPLQPYQFLLNVNGSKRKTLDLNGHTLQVWNNCPSWTTQSGLFNIDDTGDLTVMNGTIKLYNSIAGDREDTGVFNARGGTLTLTNVDVLNGRNGTTVNAQGNATVTIEGGTITAFNGFALTATGKSWVILDKNVVLTTTTGSGLVTQAADYGYGSLHSSTPSLNVISAVFEAGVEVAQSTIGQFAAQANRMVFLNGVRYNSAFPTTKSGDYYWDTAATGGCALVVNDASYTFVKNLSVVSTSATQTVTVINGTASPKTAAYGATVTVTADNIAGKVFREWFVESGDVGLKDRYSPTTTFTMGAKAVTLKAAYNNPPLTSAKFTVTAPVHGAKLIAAKTTTEHITVKNTWCVEIYPDNSFSLDLPADHIFEGGHRYRIGLEFGLEDGYSLSDDFTAKFADPTTGAETNAVQGATSCIWTVDYVAATPHVHQFDSNTGVCSGCGLWAGTLSEVSLQKIANVTGGVSVAWAPMPGATMYRVYRRATGTAKWTLIADVAQETTYIDPVASGEAYDYTVKAFNGTQYSKYSAKGISIVRLANPAVKVANATAGVKVTWGKVAGAKGYYVYRKTGSGSYSKIATTTALSYVDKTAKSGTTYTYTVRAYNGSTLSWFAGVKLLRLANTTLKLANQTAGVKLSWTKVAGAKGYYVYRKTGTGKYSQIGTTTALSYLDKTAKSGTTYTYAVRAYNGKTLSWFTGVKLIRLATPNVKLANTKSGPKATWGKVAGAKGYYVYRKTAGGSYKRIATTTSLSYVDKTAKSGTRYYYIVKAYNGKSISSYAMKAITCKK